MIVFKEIEIVGLFGETDVNIPIINNRLVIVGYNGIGKSTILNIFYYFISQQWGKLDDLDFNKITLKLKNRTRKISISKSSLSRYLENKKRYRKYSKSSGRFPHEMINLAYRALKERNGVDKKGVIQESSVGQDMRTISEELKVPARIAESLVREIRISNMVQLDLGINDGDDDDIIKADRFLSENLNGRILYLPTYRRIEKDIKTVFPEIEEDLQRKLSRRSYKGYGNENYIELVHFGMEDVIEKIDSRLEEIKGYAFSQINSLTTKYLRDVIRNEANQYEDIIAENISESSLESVFAKVDSAILNNSDKEAISSVVRKIRNSEELLENEKYVAHYILYLVEVGNNISEQEHTMRNFISVCNSYLYGKFFTFDNIAYKVDIVHDSGRPVEMEDLSSGEKQIVSLFSHLILDSNKLNYIIIDEPELSLSVDWQQRFLEDISDLRTCAFIGAVTHSPFIFENSLDNHTVDLLQHVKPSQ